MATLKEGNPANVPCWKVSEDPEQDGPFSLTGEEREVPQAGIIIAEGTYALKKDEIRNPASPDTDPKAYSLLSSLVDLSVFVSRARADSLSLSEILPTSKARTLS